MAPQNAKKSPLAGAVAKAITKVKTATRAKSTDPTFDGVHGVLADILKSNAGRTDIPRLGGDDTTSQPGVLEALLAGLDQSSDSPVYLPAPNHDAYLAPYVDAESRANKSYNDALPQIHQLYADLKGNLTTQNADYAQQVARLQAERQSQMGARISEVTAPQAEQAALVNGGEAAHGASDAQAQSANLLKESYDAENARASRLNQVDDQAATARLADADTADSSAAANARNNLSSILGQIGVQKAGAERQFQQDSAETSTRNAQLRQQYDQQRNEAAKTKLSSYLSLQESLAKQATTTGQQKFQKMLDQDGLVEKYPRQFQVFEDIVKAAGKGPTARAKALKYLSDSAGALSGGQYVTADDKAVGAKVGTDRIAQWLSLYYDDSEQVDPDLYAQLGGDPDALSYLNAGQDPNLALLMMSLGVK